MPPRRSDILQGTLALLVLRTLAARGRLHGYAITAHIQIASRELLRVEEGSLYPALYRMERDGWIAAEWGITDQGRRAKLYSVTARGRRHLAAETRELATFIAAITPVLLPA